MTSAVAALAGAVVGLVAALPASAAPALCGPVREEQIGVVRAPGAVELSGLVVSRAQPGVLFTHNDSGDSPRIFALRLDGTLLAVDRVPGAAAVDWEDMAVGPGRDGGPALYLGDIGDNTARRATVDVYRVPEPVVRSGGGGATAPAERLVLRYPDGPHDAETLLVDPRRGDLYLVTKRADGRSGVYRAAAPLPFGGRATLRRVGTLRLGPTSAATGGSVSAAGTSSSCAPTARCSSGAEIPGRAWGRRSPGARAGPRRRCTGSGRARPSRCCPTGAASSR